MNEDIAAQSKRVAFARRSLSSAYTDLDDEVKLVASAERETAVITPDLVRLLCRVVVAQRHLEDAEGAPGAGPSAPIR